MKPRTFPAIHGNAAAIIAYARENAGLGVKGVTSIGDLHVWSLTPTEHHLTCKVTVKIEDVCDCEKIISQIEDICKNQFDIQHATIQPVYSKDTLQRFCRIK